MPPRVKQPLDTGQGCHAARFPPNALFRGLNITLERPHLGCCGMGRCPIETVMRRGTLSV